MSNQLLLPCPFCGGDDLYQSTNGVDSYFVGCHQCGAEGPVVLSAVLSRKDDAATEWNRRATQPAAGEPVGWLRLEPDDNETASYHFYPNAVEGSAPVCFVTAPPAAAHGDEAVRWVPCSERLPEVAQFDQQEFIVSVQRKDKVITMSALYLNAYPLYCEDHDDADDEGYVAHTGWYDAKSNGEDANCYTLVNDSWYGSTVTHWMPMPKPAVAMRAQGDGGVA